MAPRHRNGMSPSITSSPVMGPLPEPRITTRGSPAPGGAPRPMSARARRNSLQSNADNGRARAVSSASSKPNGTAAAAAAVTTSEPSSATPFPPPAHETSAPKASSAKPEPIKSEGGGGELEGEPASTPGVDDAGGGDGAEQSESAPPPPPLISLLGTVMTKSGRASKPSTPAILAAQEAARPRSVRNTDNGGGGKKRKINSATQALAPPGDEASRGPTQGDDDDDDGDGDEPTYCYCNSVSYGEMVACDADRCQREWFHLACVGLKVAPGSKSESEPPRSALCFVFFLFFWTLTREGGSEMVLRGLQEAPENGRQEGEQPVSDGGRRRDGRATSHQPAVPFGCCGGACVPEGFQHGVFCLVLFLTLLFFGAEHAG
ncbi:hypothetical protein DCS_07644 [Drechmeria coniospora]|uniref:Zinc finger PHD-type domain-containing protein n=1 Tax=Drechmeria coniospora TaxID=98403 RepID=A0A151GF04_DRECN|nr:hypothetical protein DCS_07644 [Drechmeria coniospora]KYK55680.1 hypothetical protein DCS_07644 [Drechmeria coniospora]